MSVQPKAVGVRLGALLATAFLSHGVFLPFFPLWLKSRDLDATTIALMVAFPIIVRIVATAPVLSLPDRGFSTRYLLAVFFLGQIIGYPILLMTDGPIMIMAIVALISLAQTVVIPACDLVVTQEIQKNPRIHYGLIRGTGSLSFLLASIMCGYLVGLYGIDIVNMALTFFPILGLLVTWFWLPEGEGRPKSVHHSSAAKASKPKLPPVLWVLMLAGALTQGTHGALNAFSSIYWQSVGFSDSTIGYFWACGVIAEVAVFFMVGQSVGKKSNGLVLILIGSLASIVRFALLSTHPGTVMTFILQSMHGLSFAAAHIGAYAALTALSPAGARGKAQGIYGSLTAVTMTISTIVSGPIYREGGALVFAAMVPLGIAGFILTLVAIRMIKAQPQSALSGG